MKGFPEYLAILVGLGGEGSVLIRGQIRRSCFGRNRKPFYHQDGFALSSTAGKSRKWGRLCGQLSMYCHHTSMGR